ncbi:NAD(P)H-binding protein [Microbacterium sp. BK668]|uniref:SDR family oxidoreductase n=1 Tax=Microbacterium sp. BK668 TaxID=2512118 RepID=UPI00105F885C|nr:NAD(P)H-binding protein [Microbacterium sp. BK668]TDN91800.1 uncharacterized protein YbjT (DUF2867 family) [Microbacterium sp. BK668]
MRIAVAGGTGRAGAEAVATARARGHEVIVLARSRGVDLVAGTGVAAAVEGADVVIDASGVQGKDDPTAFHQAVTDTLVTAGARHLVVLSIVGCDRATSNPLYAGKLAQEAATEASGVPFTIARATQFHEFVRMVWDFGHKGPLHFAPRMRTQPVAVAEVGARLVDLAERGPIGGRAADLGGPREESLLEMVRAYAATVGRSSRVVPVSLPGEFGKAQRDGSLLPGPDAVLGTQTFAEWLELQRAAS